MEPIIELDQIIFTYEGANRPTLKELSLRVQPQQWLALVGVNGSGKSTLAQIINGLLEPQSGRVLITGSQLTADNVWQLRRQMGIIFQNPDHQFVGATVADDVAFGLENQGMPREQMIQRVNWALKRVKMTAFADKAPQILSGGQKQRVAIAGVIAVQPQIIIMDESTSMLDPVGRKDILQIMRQLQRELGITVVSITHDLSEIVTANQVAILQAGQIVQQGTVAEVFSHLDDLQAMGLLPPFTQQIQQKLRTAGVPLPATYQTKRRLLEELWQLHSNM
ncbi:energy-coupling factor transporter ATPase [Lactobacillus sp. DCY120]|uniref:Energy-coupling factor transporter ATPase n=1 Tax=Bombilactobacillus apium TaxID=2675299 RepID=A0A850R665_9LACO|nr:energy-coupling factor transporter ATPase [Bombilactobacillus apium]NVY96035.1 energy-coupling factor transporter ATPase [Bombilactobacillus apium]